MQAIKGPAALCVVVVCAALLPYLHVLNAPFYYDDLPNIVRNGFVHVGTFDLDSFYIAGLSSPLPSRFFAYFTFALNHYFGGLDPFGYHLVNLAIHAINSLLVLFVAHAIFSKRFPAVESKQAVWIGATTAACMFAVHPVQIQAVTYIVQRMTSLSVMFFLLAYALYILSTGAQERRKWMLLVVSAVCWFLALSCKEIAITLPAVIFLHRWLIQEHGQFLWMRAHLAAIGSLLLLTVLAYVFFDVIDGIPSFEHMYKYRPFTLQERVLTELRVVVHYLSLIAYPLPSRLNLIHTFSLSHSFLDPITTLLSFGLLSALLIVAFYYTRRFSFLSFCIFWFFVNLVLESSVIALDLSYEHRLYLPLVGISLLTGYAVARVSRAPSSVFVRAGAVVVLVALAFATYQRNLVWTDELWLWRDVMAKSPDSWSALNNYAGVLKHRGMSDLAIPYYERAVRANPRLPLTYVNYAATLNDVGRYHDAQQVIELLHERIGPHPLGYQVLGEGVAAQGKVSLAIQYYEKALSLDSNIFFAHFRLGVTYFEQENYTLALTHLQRATTIAPRERAARYYLARTFAENSDFTRAISHYRFLLRDAREPAILYHFASALIAVDSLTEAKSVLNEVITQNKRYVREAETKLRTLAN